MYSISAQQALSAWIVGKTNLDDIVVSAIPGEILDLQRQLIHIEQSKELPVGPKCKTIAWRIDYDKVDRNLIGAVAGTVARLNRKVMHLAVACLEAIGGREFDGPAAGERAGTGRDANLDYIVRTGTIQGKLGI